MCRLFISNKQDFYKYDKAHGILKLMDYLEQCCGGHGNGYALIKDGVVIESRKGMELKNVDIYTAIKEIKDWDYVIYHTRIASSGAKSDKGCHPFIDTTGHNALAMNGTIYELSKFADIMDSVDSELVFRMVQGMSALETTHVLSKLGVIFVGLADGKPYAVKGSGDLEQWQQGGKTTLHASVFPKEVKSKEVDNGYIWLNNEVIQTGRTKKAKTSLDDYDYGYGYGWNNWKNMNYSYGDGYDEGYADGFEDACKEYGISIDDDDDDRLYSDGLYADDDRYNDDGEYIYDKLTDIEKWREYEQRMRSDNDDGVYALKGGKY